MQYDFPFPERQSTNTKSNFRAGFVKAYTRVQNGKLVHVNSYPKPKRRSSFSKNQRFFVFYPSPLGTSLAL